MVEARKGMENMSEHLLQGKVAVVTGAGVGLGRAIALRFASEGATLVLASRNEKMLTRTQHLIEQIGGKAVVVPTDGREEQTVHHLVHQTLSHLARADILLNNVEAPAPTTKPLCAVVL